ncbi:hypothetical protein D3C78_1726960 [compost metagenome]
MPELRQGWLESCGTTTCGTLPALGARAEVPQLCTFLNRCPVRVDGLCNHTAPPRRIIDGGSEVLCHHDSAELLKRQQDSNSMIVGAYA